MSMELPVVGRRIAERRLVPTHRVRERLVEETVIPIEQTDQRRGQRFPFRIAELRQPRDVPLRREQRLERPRSPERHDDQPIVVLENDPRTTGFLSGVIEEQRPAVGLQIAALGGVLPGRLPWQCRSGPDLAVGMGVRGAHRLAPVLEHLDPARPAAELGRLIGPRIDVGMCPRLRSWRGEKQMTRHVPLSPSASRRRSWIRDTFASGFSAAKSFVKT